MNKTLQNWLARKMDNTEYRAASMSIIEEKAVNYLIYAKDLTEEIIGNRNLYSDQIFELATKKEQFGAEKADAAIQSAYLSSQITLSMTEINETTTLGMMRTIAIKIAVDFMTEANNLRESGRLMSLSFNELSRIGDNLIRAELGENTDQEYEKIIKMMFLNIAIGLIHKGKTENVSINA